MKVKGEASLQEENHLAQPLMDVVLLGVFGSTLSMRFPETFMIRRFKKLLKKKVVASLVRFI